MTDDYRNTKYCTPLNGIIDEKKKVVALVKEDYPQAVDMHAYISKNDEKYKREFMKVYNCKCGYCGVSIELIPKDFFEIDHYIYEKSSKFANKKDAGYIENLVLACHDCNHKKSAFIISEENYDKLYPDGDEIKHTFYRDDLFYIRISDEIMNNQEIDEFYNKLQLGKEIHRLDYLLMSLLNFKKEHANNKDLYVGMGQIIDILINKRNMM